VTTLAMITGHCTCAPCEAGGETCSRTDPCEACKATMRVGERFAADLGLAAPTRLVDLMKDDSGAVP
jgi:hypothetical protein